MTQNDQSAAPPPDWNRLAKDAFDLWQAHLSTLAADPKAKEDMALLVAPMTQMYAAWTDMTQKTLHTMMTAQGKAAEAKTETTVASKEQNQPVTRPSSPETPPDSMAETMCFSCIADSAPETAPAVEAPAPTAPAAPARTFPVEGARNLAELATRLASLENELERLRARKKGDPDNDQTLQDRFVTAK